MYILIIPDSILADRKAQDISGVMNTEILDGNELRYPLIHGLQKAVEDLEENNPNGDYYGDPILIKMP